MWLANGSASVKALTNCFCYCDYCLKRLDRLGLAISSQSFVAKNTTAALVIRHQLELAERRDVALSDLQALIFIALVVIAVAVMQLPK